MPVNSGSPALSCLVLGLILSFAPSSALVEPHGSENLDDESYGVDMLPEKPYLTGNRAADERQPGCASNMQLPSLKQLEDLIARQQCQLQQLERLVEVFRNTVQLQNAAQIRAQVGGDISANIGTLGVDNDPSMIQHDGMVMSDAHGRASHADPTQSEHGIEQQKHTTGDPEAAGGTQTSYSAQTKHQEEVAPARHVPAGGVTVARYKPAWSEHFQFISAVKVDGEVTCLHVLPHEGEEGLNRYVAVGVNSGCVYIFLSHGDLLANFSTMSHSPVTAMLSFIMRRNETILLTGHTDGTVLMHKLWETTHTGHSHGDDWHTPRMEPIQSLSLPLHTESQMPDELGKTEFENTGKPVAILEVYRIGKMRYILVSDTGGTIRVFRENGTFYGAAKSSSQPLAFLRSPNSQRLLFLSQDGAASLDLRSMTVRNGPCEGLDKSKVEAYAFDAAGRSKAYGFTAEGLMIYVALSGDTLHFECHVRSKKKLEVEGPVIPHAIKGYLLVAAPTQVLVYNTTLQVGSTHSSIPVGVPRPLFKASTDEISLTFLNTPIPNVNRPVIACNRDKLVVLGFGDGYVGIYKSNLPVQKPASFNTKVWSSPVFITILVLFGGWHFFGRKRDSLLELHPSSDIALAPSSVTSQGHVRSGLGEPRVDAPVDARQFTSASIAYPGNADNYGGAGIKLRTPVSEQGFRSSPKELSFMGSSGEPSLRSSSVEPHTYLKRELDSKFKGTVVDTSFRGSLADPNSYVKRGLEPTAYLKRESLSLKSRGSTTQPMFKTPSEPNSF